MVLLIEAIAALEKMSDCSLEDGREGQPGSEDIHGLICLAAQLAFEVTNSHVVLGGHPELSTLSKAYTECDPPPSQISTLIMLIFNDPV